MITVVAPSRYRINKKTIQTYVAEGIKFARLDAEKNLNIVFVGKRKMKQIALRYKQENVALPVLSFSYTDDAQVPELLGEIFLCYPQLILLAAERNKRVEETIHAMIKHGIDNIKNDK